MAPDLDKIYTCDKCKRKFIYRDIRFFNHTPMCNKCFFKLPEEQRKNLTCIVEGCNNPRREDKRSEFCSFHLSERLEELTEMAKELDEKKLDTMKESFVEELQKDMPEFLEYLEKNFFKHYFEFKDSKNKDGTTNNKP